jgi:hypothetical protein
VAFETKAKVKLFIKNSTSGCKTYYKCKTCGSFHASSQTSEDKRKFKDANSIREVSK